GFDGIRYSCLRGRNYPITDFQMPGHADLAGENHASANLRAAGEADLGAEQRIFADVGRMPDLDQIVYFCATPNARFANRRPVHGGVGADLYIVFEHDNAGLDDLVVAAIVSLCVSVSIRSDL